MFQHCRCLGWSAPLQKHLLLHRYMGDNQFVTRNNELVPFTITDVFYTKVGITKCITMFLFLRF